MPSSSHSDDPHHGSPTQGSGGFLKRKSFGLKKTPFKGKRPGKKGGSKSKDEALPPPQQSLGKIKESTPPPSQDPPSSLIEAKSSDAANPEVEVVADDAFLKALRGADSADDHDSVAKEKKTALGKNDSSADNDAAFLRALRGQDEVSVSENPGAGISKEPKGATAPSGRSETDNAWLQALHGGSGTPSAKTPSSQSEADNAFLQALQGSSGTPSATLTRNPKQAYPPTPKAKAELTGADVDFLAAMRGSPPPVPVSLPGSRDSSPHQSRKRASQGKLDMPTLPVVLSANNLNADNGGEPKDELSHANAAFLGALHAASVPTDDADSKRAPYPDGSFIATKIGKNRPGGGPPSHAKPQKDSDSEFLTAMRGSQFGSSAGQSSGGGAYESGTLVLNGPKAGGDANDRVQSSNDAFMMAIQASAEDGDASAALAERELTDASHDVAVEEEEDVDIEGIKIPQRPFLEKVMLPRPLFFGHVLPPRIAEEASRAASTYASDVGETDTKETVSPAPPPDTAAGADTESASAAADDSSVVSKSSVSSMSSFAAGGKRFESSIAPCCRNLDGALEAFGFGLNPFAPNAPTAETEVEPGEPVAPHPYVSIYSPVWDEWSRTARAKARRRVAQLNGKVEAAKIEQTSAPPIRASKPPTLRRKHKKSVSMDFLEMLENSIGNAPPESNVDQARVQHSPINTVDTASLTSTETPQLAADNSDNTDFAQDQFLRYARAGTAEDVSTETPQLATDNSDNTDFAQDQFLRYARAGTAEGASGGGSFLGSLNADDGKGTFISSQPPSKAFSVPPMDGSTFVQAAKSSDDDDSIEAAEERQAVGLNDNISAAAAMLAGEGALDEDGDENRIGASMLMAVGGGVKSANKYGRPYSNFELTNGCTPQFGCDDPSLPHESDLGVFETKEEEKRNAERRRERSMIEDYTVPGIMPHVTCPTLCSDMDDSVSWNPRVSESDLGNRTNSNTMLISLDGDPSTNHEKSPTQQTPSTLYETSRVAWWNLPDGHDKKASPAKNGSRGRNAHRNPPVEVFPASDDPIPLDVQTHLWPPPSLVRENNMSGTRLHPATSTARLLPHLSDRPPSTRHLQIDTTAVGFPKLGGEIEPMFCRLAIYHFELGSERRHSSDSVSTSASSYAPIPNMERSGPVTESLNFDIVQDPEVVQNCKHAIWPYSKEPDATGGLTTAFDSVDNSPKDAESEGTSCGVFPLPANLSISNLYAVIIVHKVIAESTEMQPYYKPGRHEPKQENVPSLESLRDSAKVACEQYGHIITPFAFGVVPLKHIVGGEESPKIPVSRAVQIPLFKFDPECGPTSIFDHILMMLHPRAEPRRGKGASMTRGHALLVMRYFGYLGLHSILTKKSSLARDRLVDFTGELQVKCKKEKDPRLGKSKEKCPALGDTYVLPPWRDEYAIEPAPHGGRNCATSAPEKASATRSLYAQEIAALPLERAVPEKSSGRSKSSHHRGKYDGMILHRSFCNELVCQPKMIQRCSKKNIVVKLELRELIWNDRLNTEIAVPLAPSIHNTRRGPWLVQEAFSSCALGSPQFLDQFKVKLPLVLGAPGHERIGLMFSVYHLNPKRKRRSRLVPRQHDGNEAELGGYSIEPLGSGFLPLALENNPTCLIANGTHDVPINFRAVAISDAEASFSVPRHQKRFSFGSWSSHSDANEIRMSKSGDTKSEKGGSPEHQPVVDETYPEGSLALVRSSAPPPDDDARDTDDISSKSSLVMDDVQPSRSVSSAGDLKLLGSRSESSVKDPLENEMVLKVTVIAFTSVHPQNKTLSDLFLTRPKPPRALMPSDFSEPYSPWGKYRSEIIYRLKPERIPPFMFVGGALAESERTLLQPVLSLTKSSKCPHADLMAHLVRVVAQLWRTAVSGAGEPSILWASPESLIPLRLNAFATLLHTVSSAAHHMAKAGLRQLDGNATWDITALGKILSILFDERAIFGGPLEDARRVKSPSPKKSPLSRPDILANRAKTVHKESFSARPKIVERYSSEDSPKITQVKKFDFDVDAMLKSSTTPQATNVSANADMADDLGSEVDSINPQTSGDSGFKVDSKNDFMSALRTASRDDTAADAPEQQPSSRSNADSFFKAASHGPVANRRRWMTLPTNALSTIQENEGEETSGVGDRGIRSQKVSSNKDDSMDTEIVLHPGMKTKSRQMRVPQVEPKGDIEPLSSFLDSLAPPTETKPKKEPDNPPRSPDRQRTLVTDDKDIETAGTAFLDAIGKSMGLGTQGKDTEERRVGAAHHRKTRSRCSIDWSLPPNKTDMLLEKDQQVEQRNRKRSGDVPPILPLSPLGLITDESSSDDDTAENSSSVDGGQSDADAKKLHPLKRHQRSTSRGEFQSAEATILPDFADRMSDMKNDGSEKRWWPYVYEVIIYQWLALLEEQTKKGDSKKSEEAKPERNTPIFSPIVVKYLSHAAKAARGATIRCAPYLLEIVKESLSWRVDCVFRERKKKRPSLDETSCEDAPPPLVKLDKEIMSALERLITLLTDASVDSRNFDSFEYRKISIDVNDAVVRFIRDLFSILDAQLCHRLVMVYFSRFVTKQGKHWSDRDSKITGLRCSWETTKLRLNAITLFVRFPGFMTVCSPVMESWALPDGLSVDAARSFFSDTLEKINRLGLSEFTAPDGPVSKEEVAIPRMKPHWLAELCTDICLSATGHAEESIQFRASSLLFELFWQHSLQGRVKGNLSVVASVFLPFVEKILTHLDYLSSLPAKGQLRKDILPCSLFVLQSAPVGLIRALWRKLTKRAEGKTQRRDSVDKFGGIPGSGTGLGRNSFLATLLPGSERQVDDFEMDDEANIFDVFGLLNLSLSTIEYEGCTNLGEEDDGAATECEEKPTWRREYLLSSNVKTKVDPRNRPFKYYQPESTVGETGTTEQLTTDDSRRWHAHDCSIVIINICRQIVREILGMLKPNLGVSDGTSDAEFSCAGFSDGSQSFGSILIQPTSSTLDEFEAGGIAGAQHENGKAGRLKKSLRNRKPETLTFTVTDQIICVRAAASVYLQALSMRQSDVVITKTLTAAVEIVKIFGIKLFLLGVGETLQHWMRVILEHCGARRADLRVDACEFLNLILRLTWEAYGSFSRVKLPLLAVQSEVMERIVAKAASKYVTEQRALGFTPIPLFNDGAEASLTPLWRTIDRLHNQSASQNLSFKSALARLAIKMKRIYRAYLAAHALAIVNRSESENHGNDGVPSQPNPYVQRLRVSVHRIVSNSSWFSKQFLGNQTSVALDRKMIQTEAVEDSFVIAADVFSPTELPSHRVAWLQKLAEFHRMRGRFAEEATCRFYIYHTYRDAARQHDHIWSSSPFLPWASNSLDLGGEGHAIVSDFDYEMENCSGGSGKQSDAFRRIFYRSADSVRVRSGDWGAVSGGKYLFYGVTLKSEFDSVSPWFSHREMEENMAEQAEISGDLYLRAGIVESSRYAWSLANQFYSETFNYARLAYVYRRLALVVTSQVPIIDVSNQLDLSSQIGRFYKVYFHGGAPDDLLHSQGSEGFIYRVPNSVQIRDFASRLESAVRCILPNKTTIDLHLDDGSPTLAARTSGGKRQAVIGGAPIEPAKIKITPLRPLFKMEDNEKCFRGTPEWFQLKVEEHEFETELESARTSGGTALTALQHHRSQSTSTTNSLTSVGSATMSSRRSSRSHFRKSSLVQQGLSDEFNKGGGAHGELIGVDRFYFTQPMKKDPARGFRDWLKVPKGKIAERSLRVTELQVENPFPACITRQKIIHRAVFTQSPLEASVEAVSTWCSVLFRTIIATNGQGVLGGQRHQGLSADSAKLVMECIHSSGVKRIGATFLSVTSRLEESNADADMYSPYETLDEDEVERVQTKLARMIVTFLELLHLLIARNRDVLLAVVQSRKRNKGDEMSVASGSVHGGYAASTRAGSMTFSSPMRRTASVAESSQGHTYDRSSGSEFVGRSIVADPHMSHGHISHNSDRTDSAIGVQSELQRGLISLVKSLSPNLLTTLTNEVPRWMRSCIQDNYFSSGLYRQADIPIGEELFFNVDSGGDERGSRSGGSSYAVPRSITKGPSPNGSFRSATSDRRMERTRSTATERPPTDRSFHRRMASGASYASNRSGRGESRP